MRRLDWFFVALLSLFSVIITLDLFIHPGRPATYDGPTHITTIAQFYSSLKAQEFPVRWSGNYGNYGQPLPLYAHQLPAYLGGFLTFITHSPELSYNLLVLFATLSATLVIYFLLRQYSQPLPSFVGTVLFNLSAYRLSNLFMRGALPEYFSATWIGLNLYALGQKKYWLYCLSLALLVLTHPLVAALYSLCLSLYFIGSIIQPVRHYSDLFKFIASSFVAFLLTGYYLVPFLLESKYLIVGHEHPTISGFLNPGAFLTESWPYYSTGSHPGPRPNLIQFGLLESLTILMGIFAGLKWRSSKFIRLSLISILIICLTLPFSAYVYRIIPKLATIQYAYRWLSLLIFIPPVILALTLDRLKKSWVSIVVLLCILVVRVPQLYAKNYYQVPQALYYSTVATLHTQNLATVWMGHWRDYPPKTKPVDIIDGQGYLNIQNISNLTHTYQISSPAGVRIIDYTFYFPGWQVLVDGVKVPIEYQDMNHRGIITFNVPAGDHTVEVLFTNTRVRQFSNYLSLLGLPGFLLLLVIDRRKVPVSFWLRPHLSG